MTADRPALFDDALIARRRRRARRLGLSLFLDERMVELALEQLAMLAQPVTRVALDHWAFAELAPIMAAAGYEVVDAATDDGPWPAAVSIGMLDMANDPRRSIEQLRQKLAPGGCLIALFVGGHSLPLLRALVAAAERGTGQARPHIHPMIDAASLTALAEAAGLGESVVSVDRIALRYRQFADLRRDLISGGRTNMLTARPQWGFGRAERAAMLAEFMARREGDGRATEQVELLSLIGWTSQK